MKESSASSLLKQRKRLRELAKYYETVLPYDADHPGTGLPLAKVEIEGFTLALPTLAADTHLTALAQLAACRTACHRCFISIIDHHAQHIIAESTRSISPFHQDIYDDKDGLLVGAQSLPLGYSICPAVFDEFTESSSLPLGDPSNQASKDSVIIADLRSEVKTKHLPIIRNLPPVLRYCVTVPLRSDSGAALGSICVVDSHPQPANLKHVVILQDLARLVVQHLGASRMRADHQRAERLLSGLAHFVRGQDSMSAWSEITRGQNFIPTIKSQPEGLSRSSLASLATESSRRAPSDATTMLSPLDSTDLSTVSTSTNLTVTPSGTEDNDTGISSVSSRANGVESAFEPARVDDQTAANPSPTSSEVNITINSTFSRASNLIREAMDLDATTFLEVPHNYRFKSRVGKSEEDEDTSDRHGSSSSPPSTSESESVTDSSDISHNNSDADVEPSSEKKILCRRLGFSTKLKSSLVGSSVQKPFMTISVGLLKRLTQRYPEGHIFNFDSFGSISSGDDDGTAVDRRQPGSPRKNLAARLSRMFPAARSLIFLPLYDNDKQQIYAGFIGMTMSSTRSLQKHESTYVAAFTNSLMCEVMRLEALTTDKAKSDFISSISHELRSPLHGILASSQLLADSKMEPEQMGYVQMVDTCARTLLDIMDHLLDHAKINQFTKHKEQRRESRERSKKPQLKLYSLLSNVNMLSIVEDTASSMAASRHPALQATEGTRSASISDEGLTVPILLDIPPYAIWNFDTEAGSWRRIIMNLIGNSLKYTQQGHVKVSFRLQKQSEKTCLAELKVVDTGQGISKEYLNHRLYTPFAQENNLSVGVGLGLSLVNQIVASLHGDMQIFSEGGNGTEVSIKVPLNVSTDIERQQPAEIDDSDFQAAMAQQTYAFVGLDERPSLSEEPTGVSSPRMKALSAMKESLSNLLAKWFKSRLVASDASILVVEESHLADNLEELDRPGRCLLIIGLDGRQSKFINQVTQASHVRLLAPIGPTRMAAALRLLLQQQKEPRPSRSSSPRQTIEMRLPAPRATSGHAPSRSLTPNSEEPKEAILLVDDNEINLRILVTCVKRLKLRGVELLTAVDGKEALDKYVAAIENGMRISVVFMDISMPIMDGFQSTREIRSFEKRKGFATNDRTKIVALTGLASGEAVQEVEASGFDSYLRKPVNLATIKEVLMAARM